MRWMWDKVELNARQSRLSSRDLFILSPCLELHRIHSFVQCPKQHKKRFLETSKHFSSTRKLVYVCVFSKESPLCESTRRWIADTFYVYTQSQHMVTCMSHRVGERRKILFYRSWQLQWTLIIKFFRFSSLPPFTNIILTNISGRWVMLCSSVFGRAAKIKSTQ